MQYPLLSISNVYAKIDDGMKYSNGSLETHISSFVFVFFSQTSTGLFFSPWIYTMNLLWSHNKLPSKLAAGSPWTTLGISPRAFQERVRSAMDAVCMATNRTCRSRPVQKMTRAVIASLVTSWVHRQRRCPAKRTFCHRYCAREDSACAKHRQVSANASVATVAPVCCCIRRHPPLRPLTLPHQNQEVVRWGERERVC